MRHKEPGPAEPEYDPEIEAVAKYVRRLAAYEAFDTIIDMALDNVITMDEAISAYKIDFIDPPDDLPANQSPRQT